QRAVGEAGSTSKKCGVAKPPAWSDTPRMFKRRGTALRGFSFTGFIETYIQKP
ncbi:MAG: hypothetical protein ACI8S7_001639, partial [Candidatus Krumholzibacteriia bacterium]